MKNKLLTILSLYALAVLLPMTCMAQTVVPIAWDASPTPGVSYNIYRTKTLTGCATPGPACVGVNSSPITVLTFSDTPGVSGRWFYVVRAVDADGIESDNAKLLLDPTQDHLMEIIKPEPGKNLRKN